jgi:hypothetical protein
MVRLGLRLSLRSGREALIRLVLTTLAVALGATLLLAVFAEFHAFQVTSRRPSWESTVAAQGAVSTSNQELWNYTENLFHGQFIEELDVAALGPNAPVVPGIPRLPISGQYYASPALAALIRSTPRAELGDRFAGIQVGTMGSKALAGPNELAIVVGYSPTAMSAFPNTIRVDKIATAPQTQGTTNIYRLAFVAGAIALLFPLLILINTATRLAAARREERYAAMRLVGATSRQTNVLASVDAGVGALFGTLIGIGIFLLVRPALGHITFSGARFFAPTITPTVWGYGGMLVGVPIAAATASLWSLRRVRISPLGVSRRVTPPAPKVWRVTPLLLGLPVFVLPVVLNSTNPSTAPVFIGLLLIMVGLIMGGSWLTMQAARLLARLTRGAASLLAARRLSDNPKGAFRTVSGLVLAVFVGTAIAGIVGAMNAGQTKGTVGQLTDVLRVPSISSPGDGGTSGPAATTLVTRLQAYPGARVIPIYSNPGFDAFLQTHNGPGVRGPGRVDTGSVPPENVVSCADLAQLPVLGTCPPGAKAVAADISTVLNTDNPLIMAKNLPAVHPSSPAVSNDLANMPLAMLLVKADNARVLEEVRTFLTSYTKNTIGVAPKDAGGASLLSAWQMGSLEPETFSEVAQTRKNTYDNVERVILALVGLTLLVAGCSLAVTVGGSIVDRKRPFAMLRLSGTSTNTLYRVVILESVLPLVTAAVVAAVTGAAVALPIIQAVLPKELHAAYPGHLYYEAMAAGLVVSLMAIVAALPLLGRVTAPANARFE